ncbi:DUF3999 family protein [Aquimarina sp. SS2-1]|uniref:DUF3999 family protein n=1 Tax=Aquimarina besae TaxID=3342247 RepID=UPI00366CB349
MILGLFLICSSIYGQMNTYDYKRPLSGITDNWHVVELPDEIFKKISSDFSDIRIFGITKEIDTIEAPFLLKQNQPKNYSKKIDFEMINRSKNTQGTFVTFKVPIDQTINQIRLFFQEMNFDRLLALEGSQNLDNWFTIVDNYRILSIQNESATYDFTTINFPNSKYQYYRVFVKGSDAPQINSAQVTLKEEVKGNYKIYNIKSVNTQEEKQSKRTVIDIELDNHVPVSYLKVNIKNNFDYYRSFRIEYLQDSIQKDNGWRYDYRNITSGILNSFEKNEFNFRSIITNRLRLTIDNQDNEALDIEAIEVKGFSHELLVRFTTPADYFLIYGNKNVLKPSYDLRYVTKVVPEKLTKVRLGAEENIPKSPKEIVEPLIKNKVWLWAVMGVVILLLGGFTLMMMKKK